ncbi:MAG: HD-GYP domain-containing protein [Deltaproteobacteria bacterium]|nr:HD-GYP domain-containing protein [Deltaproteobacteria bacterium]
MKKPDLRSVTPAELKIGMYVILPLAWHEHPFLKSHFLIQSEAEISKIRELGIKGIQIDLSKSRPVEIASAGEPQAPSASEQQKPEQKVVTDDLIATIHDESLPPRKKSRLVRQHSIAMMKSLLENPNTQNMKEAQKGISELVSLILTDDDTLHYLLDITSHDFYTYTHSVGVGVLGIAIAKSLFKDSTNHDMRALGVGFFLHDVGKVGIDPSIITKPGKLTFEEMQEMKRHPSLGYKLLHETRQLTEEAKTIVLQHHERIDGSGYPKGLRGGDIHLYGRLCSIADVYDALTSDRPYRKKMPPFAALKIMQDEMIHHFQKDLFQTFVLMFKAPA